ncbi:O-antigen ligase family protein [Deinococcus lacus]|uniref:O-antigen ligase family protein n=1 Tax=Deinococcus lacus TaxID=392561 RepID=A0ABW1YF58_9DEIO
MAKPTPAADPSRLPATQGQGSSGRFLAAAVILVPLGAAVLGQLRHFRALPSEMQALLSAFVVLQLVAALFTPHPIISLALAGLRAAVLVSWIVYGYQRASTLQLKWLAGALAGVVAAAAALAAYLRLQAGPGDPLPRALEFLYISSNGMSVLGMLLVFLAALQGSWHWTARMLLGLVGTTSLVLGMGKTAWVACALGLAAAYWPRLPAWLRGSSVAAALAGLLAVAALPQLQNTLRTWLPPVRQALSGRDTVWADAARTAQAHPLGGTGPYQYGAWAAPNDPCATLTTLESVSSACPAWLNSFGQPWRIAHNAALHAFAETGTVGGAGWLLLFGAAVFGAWKSRWPLARAVVAGSVGLNTLDNVTLLPSPGYAEIFFVIVGASWGLYAQREKAAKAPDAGQAADNLNRTKTLGQVTALSAAVAVGTLAVPWVLMTPPGLPGRVEVQHFITPPHYEPGEVYALYAQLHWPAQQKQSTRKPYLVIEQCTRLNICSRIGGASFADAAEMVSAGQVGAEAGGYELKEWVYARVTSTPEQTVRLRASVFVPGTGLPLAELATWEVSAVER